MDEMLLIKLAVTLFVLAGIMCAIAGSIQCYQFTKRFNSTIKTILYSGFIITGSISILANLSYRGVPLVVICGMVFAVVGGCTVLETFYYQIRRIKCLVIS